MDDTITPTRAAMALLNPAIAAPTLAEAFEVTQFSKRELVRNITNDVSFHDYLEMLKLLDFNEKQDLIDLALQTAVDSPPIPATIPRFLTSIRPKEEFCRLLSVMQLCQPAQEDTLWENYRTAWRSCRMDQHLDLRYQALQHSPDSGYETPPHLRALAQPLQPQTIAQLPVPSVTHPPVLQITAGTQAQPAVQSNLVQPGPANQQPSSADQTNASASQISPKSAAKSKHDRKVKTKAKSKSSSKVVSRSSSKTKPHHPTLESALAKKHRKNQKRKERRRQSAAGDDSGEAAQRTGSTFDVETQSSPNSDLVQESEQAGLSEPVRKSKTAQETEPVQESEPVQQRVTTNTTAEHKQSKTKAEKRKGSKKSKRVQDKELRRKARKQAKRASMDESTKPSRKSPSLPTPSELATQAQPDAPSSPALHEITSFGVLPSASAATNKSVKFYDAPSTPLDLERNAPSRSPLSLKASRVAARSSPQNDPSGVMLEHAKTSALQSQQDDSSVKPSSSINQTNPADAPSKPSNSTNQTNPTNALSKIANPARFGPLGDPSSTSIQIPRAADNPANIIQAQIDEMAANDSSDSDSDSDSSDDVAVARSTRREDDWNASRLRTDKLLWIRPAFAQGQSSQQQDDKDTTVRDHDGGKGAAAGSSIPPAVSSTLAAGGVFNYTERVKAALRDDCAFEGVASDCDETPMPIESSAEEDSDVQMVEPAAEQHNLQPPTLEDEIAMSGPHRADLPDGIEDDAQADLPSSSEVLPRQEHDASVSGSTPHNNDHSVRIATDSDIHDKQALLQLSGEFESSYRRQSHSQAASSPSTPSRRANDPVEIIVYRSSEKQRRQLQAECARAEPQESNNNKATLESEQDAAANGDVPAPGEDSSPLSELDQTPPLPALHQEPGASSSQQANLGEDKEKSKKRKRKSTVGTSGHVDTPPKKRRVPAGISTAAFPPTSNQSFGLIQEELWRDPFRLLVAVTFLNKTTGKSAVPIYRQLMKRYPTPEDLAKANIDDVCAMIQRLGLQNTRAKKLVRLAQEWSANPPQKSLSYRTMHYPEHGDGSTHRPAAILEEDNEKCEGFLEVGHLYGLGPYAWDSWRIFCRDVMRGVATDYNGKDAADPDFEPEWKRVLPNDKELRACLQWMWLREGWDWNPLTGEKVPANAQLLQKAAEGMTIWPMPEETREQYLSEEALALGNIAEGASGSKRVTTDGEDGDRVETGSVELDFEPRRGNADAREDGAEMSEKRKGKLPAREASIEL